MGRRSARSGYSSKSLFTKKKSSAEQQPQNGVAPKAPVTSPRAEDSNAIVNIQVRNMKDKQTASPASQSNELPISDDQANSVPTDKNFDYISMDNLAEAKSQSPNHQAHFVA